MSDPAFHRLDGCLHAEGVSLERIAAEVGSPCYVYCRAAIEARYLAFEQALDGIAHRICYSVKANSNLAVLDVLARLGSGFDIVSGGELARVLAAGAPADRIVFSGVGKTDAEMRAALEAGIACFNVESDGELDRLAAQASSLGVIAPVSFRVNPDVDPLTHPYIATGLRESKFGIPIEAAPALFRRAAGMSAIEVRGVDCHIGSQQTVIGPFVDVVARLLALVDRLAADGIQIRHVDLGGGYGIRYREESPPQPAAFGDALRRALAGRDVEIVIEPGRSIVGNAGLLLTRVVELKTNGDKRFAVVDAAMNDLLRPALYEAWHEVVPVRERPESAAARLDVVGPICESSDFLALDRALAVERGDLVAVMSAGAYGFAMSSNYNSRPRVAEVMVDGATVHVVRARESVDSLFALESRLPG